MTTPGRRWSRFSLRTLFVVLTACAAGLPVAQSAIERYRDWQQEQVHRKFAEVINAIDASRVPWPDDAPAEYPESKGCEIYLSTPEDSPATQADRA